MVHPHLFIALKTKFATTTFLSANITVAGIWRVYRWSSDQSGLCSHLFLAASNSSRQYKTTRSPFLVSRVSQTENTKITFQAWRGVGWTPLKPSWAVLPAPASKFRERRTQAMAPIARFELRSSPAFCRRRISALRHIAWIPLLQTAITGVFSIFVATTRHSSLCGISHTLTSFPLTVTHLWSMYPGVRDAGRYLRQTKMNVLAARKTHVQIWYFQYIPAFLYLHCHLFTLVALLFNAIFKQYLWLQQN